MTDAQAWAFLEAPARPAILATTMEDGRAHAVPVSYLLEGTTLVFMTGRESLKGQNMLRDPRVSLCVQDDVEPFSFVTIRGSVTLSEDPGERFEMAKRLGGRYHGEARAEEFGLRNAVEGHMIVRVHVDRITGTNNVADYPEPS